MIPLAFRGWQCHEGDKVTTTTQITLVFKGTKDSCSHTMAISHILELV